MSPHNIYEDHLAVDATWEAGWHEERDICFTSGEDSDAF